ncbi:DUF4012 domain-containing protein [Microbacterium oxydans]|uniref:DUF4012 domain-containing protein n=1 Tax=Microbacterium TaxID=33882 RepID=UPI0011BD99E4|nr:MULTISPECIES: DUF4012 domain-containing protein [unclassified Microbacterium]MBE7953419.1 DUF4012 domain-containing protein [Microbacterium sp. R1]NYF27185.1 hypothetical protein [Microbacterium sp. JAI119]
MTRDSRRARRAQNEQQRRKSRRTRIILWVVGVVLALLIAVAVIAAILIPKALDAKDKLEASVPLAQSIPGLIASGDTAGAQAAAEELTKTAASAHEQTSGFLWESLEWVPVIGPNLHGVRMATAAVDELATKALLPASGIDIAALRPSDGGLDLQAIHGIGDIARSADQAVRDASSMLAGVDHDALLGPVASGVERIEKVLKPAASTLAGVMPLVEALPEMLGEGGPRDVLVIFQNNGEVMSGGGTIGSMAQVHIDNGAISIVNQSSASGRDFPNFRPPVGGVTQEETDLYGSLFGSYVQALTRSPRFDRTFEIARDMWREAKGVEVDAVVSLDTVALSYLLVATGPVAIPGGPEISNSNAVAMLLGDLYKTYEPAEVDMINQVFAGLTLQKLMGGQVDFAKLSSVLGLAAKEGRIAIWSARESEQQLIAGTDLDRRGPRAAEGTEAFGVYFIDWTPGKMQRYMTQSIDVSQPVCAADGRRHVFVTVTLANTVDPASVRGLPEYVTGVGIETPKGSMQVETLAFAPPGYSPVGQRADAELAQSEVRKDQEFTVGTMRLTLAPQESRTLTYEFVADSDAPTKIELDSTPVVTPTVLTQDAVTCQ